MRDHSLPWGLGKYRLSHVVAVAGGWGVVLIVLEDTLATSGNVHTL